MQVPDYKDPFPDWDTEDWAVLVTPNVPVFLWIAGGICVAFMVIMIVVMARRRQLKTQRTAALDLNADKASTWL